MNFLNRIFCVIFGHHWTCASDEGIDRTQKQFKDGPAGFLDYAKRYCKTCGHIENPVEKYEFKKFDEKRKWPEFLSGVNRVK